MALFKIIINTSEKRLKSFSESADFISDLVLALLRSASNGHFSGVSEVLNEQFSLGLLIQQRL